MSDSEHIVKTGLNGAKNLEILYSVIGQMSDGIWENTSGMKRYWAYCHIDKDCNIIVDTSWGSGFRDYDDQKVIKFFARKIKRICDIEKEDNSRYYDCSFSYDNNTVSRYLDRHNGNDVSFSDALSAYRYLLRVANGNIDPEHPEISAKKETVKTSDNPVTLESFGFSV